MAGGLEGLANSFGRVEEKETGIMPLPYLQLFLESDYMLYIMKAD